MKFVFLLEEKSTKVLLDELLPRILPGIQCITISHEGKSDLRKSIPIKLAHWIEPGVQFVIIQDQDSNDCKRLKADLQALCQECGKEAIIRIACHEMEAWYFGDLKAVSKAYQKDLTSYAEKRKFRVPDDIMSPKQELRRLVPEHQQIAGAKRIAPFMDIENNTSASFNALIEKLREVAAYEQP